nr:uncharacterized protein LOC109993919 [Labrus bergylta]
MSGRRFSESWRLLDKVTGNLSWEECYAVSRTEWNFPEDTDQLVSATESDVDDPGENELVAPKEENPFYSTPSSPLKLHSTSGAILPFPATTPVPPQRAPRSRSKTPSQWRRRRAAASHPYKARGYRKYRAPVSGRRSCGCCCCCNCSGRRYRPRGCVQRRRRYRLTPRVPSWEHLPVAIQPTKWYQVVGSMQCSHCKTQGRHQMTSWMCQICEEPLCLMPHRNCYALWHGQRF